MRRVLAAVAAALLLASHGGASAALVAQIDGRVSYTYLRSYLGGLYPGAQDIVQTDTVQFKKDLTPNYLTPNYLTLFAVASESADRVGAEAVLRLGDGWMRFYGMAHADISATPYGVTAYGVASYIASVYVQDSITIDAPGKTGQAGSATLGFLIDGVLSAAAERNPDRSVADAGGRAQLGIGLGNIVAVLEGDVSTYLPGLNPLLGYDEEFMGGVVDFVFGTPFHYRIAFYTLGVVRGGSYYQLGENLGGLPAITTMVSDFGNTITWAGVSNLIDAEGKPVTAFTAISSSGTDFRYRIFPDDVEPPDNVPEPSTALLMLAGLAALSWRRWKPGLTRRSGSSIRELSPWLGSPPLRPIPARSSTTQLGVVDRTFLFGAVAKLAAGFR